jgi:membrane protease YdiL (CAAX protease family)
MPTRARAGSVDSGTGGFVLGAAYLLSGRNLWAAILAHGFVDTLGVGLLCFGLAS